MSLSLLIRPPAEGRLRVRRFRMGLDSRKLLSIPFPSAVSEPGVKFWPLLYSN